MRRRSFLKLLALASAGASLPWAASAAASSRRSSSAVATPSAAPSARRYRGRGGRIYSSSDAGRSWELHTYLGPDYDVTRVMTDGAGGARATVGFRGRTFALALAPDLRSWLTD